MEDFPFGLYKCAGVWRRRWASCNGNRVSCWEGGGFVLRDDGSSYCLFARGVGSGGVEIAWGNSMPCSCRESSPDLQAMNGVWTLEKTVRGRGRYCKFAMCNLGNAHGRLWRWGLHGTDLLVESLGIAVADDGCVFSLEVYIITRSPGLEFVASSFLFLLLE